MSNQPSLGDISGSGGSKGAGSEEESEDYFRFSIPSEWEVRPISRIGEVQGGSTPKTETEEYWDGGIPWLTPTEVTESSKIKVSDTERNITEEGYQSASTHLMPENSVLLTTRATIGTASINEVPMCTNQGFQNIHPEDDVNTLYLYYQIRHAADYLDSLGSGSTFNEVSKSMLQNVELPVPEKDEQRRIASVLYNVDRAIQKTEEIIEQTQRVKKGLIQVLLTNGIGHEEEEFKEVRIGPNSYQIPENWGMKPLNPERGLTTQVTDGSHYSPDQKTHHDYFYATVKDMYDGGINYDSCGKIDKEQYEKMVKGDCKPTEGDVLFSKDGTVGRTAVFRGEKNVVLLSSIAIIRLAEELHPGFLRHYLSSYITDKQISALKSGTAIRRVVLGDIKQFEVFLPPKEEQKEIAEKIDLVETKIANHKNQKEQLQRLKRGLMQDLLTGEVRTGETVDVLDEVVEV